MVMSWIWTGLLLASTLCALITGRGAALASASVEGAQAGVTLAISLGGSLCLWAGVGKLMEKAGVTAMLSRFLRPVLGRLFPSSRADGYLAGQLSGNVCANFLGLGNAATPMGLKAAHRMAKSPNSSDELCRLIVLNTASIQLIPTNVAAVRAGMGCRTPFDILPAVWLTSLLSASMGLLAAWGLGKLWRD